MSQPQTVLIEAAKEMIKECMKQIDGDLANSTLELAAPNHTVNAWGQGKGEQVVFMTGRLDGLERFDAICVFTLGKTGSVTIKFKSGRYQSKRCSVPCAHADRIWKPALSEIQWDDEAT